MMLHNYYNRKKTTTRGSHFTAKMKFVLPQLRWKAFPGNHRCN